MHGVFQFKYYGHHIDVDPDPHDAYRDHPWFDSCANFCEQWDQESFDPDYPTEPIETFDRCCARSSAAAVRPVHRRCRRRTPGSGG